MNIKTHTIEETPQLFRDYLQDAPELQGFFTHTHSKLEDAITAPRGRTADRAQLATLLARQNSSWGASEESLANVKKLEDARTLAVVTGQQAGLLGGPLYTFYKTMSVIRLCEALNEKFSENNFVPVFWLEVNDSDFKEIAQLHYPEKDNSLQSHILEENERESMLSINARKVESTIQAWREQIEAATIASEFRDDALESLLGVYRPGSSYTGALAKILTKYFGKYGLILINPADPQMASLTAALYEEVVHQSAELVAAGISQSEKLESAGYHSQIKFRSGQTLLFFTDDGQRRIRIDDNGDETFIIRDPESPKTISAAELASKTAQLSPNVALRPLLQDFLLPTVAYIGGPGEIAYSAQLRPLYELLDIAQPAMIPRHRLTIVESKMQRIFGKLGIDVVDILAEGTGIQSRVIQQNTEGGLFDAISNTERDFVERLGTLKPELQQLDPALISALEKTEQNLTRSLQNLKDRVTRAETQKNQVVMNQLSAVLTNLRPNDSYQERVISPLYFLIKYGPEFFDQILQLLPEDSSQHLVVEL